MKRIAPFVLVVLPLLLTASCASAPNWSGVETEAGELIFTQSPGFRFFINVLLLGALIALFVFGVFKKKTEDEKKDKLGFDHIGCLAFIFLIVCIALWRNISQNVWTESVSINPERVERTFYPSADAPIKQRIDWNNVVSCEYFTGKFNVTKWKMQVAGDTWEEGETRRAIGFTDKDKRSVTIVVEKDEYDTNWRSFFVEPLFGSNDIAFSPDDEARLKKAINKYLPENAKQNMTPETREYLITTEEK